MSLWSIVLNCADISSSTGLNSISTEFNQEKISNEAVENIHVRNSCYDVGMQQYVYQNTKIFKIIFRLCKTMCYHSL